MLPKSDLKLAGGLSRSYSQDFSFLVKSYSSTVGEVPIFLPREQQEHTTTAVTKQCGILLTVPFFPHQF